MANWCWHTLTITGEPKNIAKVKLMLQAMDSNEHGHKPDFYKPEEEPEEYFFSVGIYVDEPTMLELNYTTKWSPNLEDLVKIAEHFDVSFSVQYEESGNMIYGRATYSKEEGLVNTRLDYSDYDQFTHDEETDLYTFENEEYDGSDEICEIILTRKENDRIRKMGTRQ